MGKHSDKSYCEKIVIDQYVNNLEFHVSIGVRISNPQTLVTAIINARQEEARLTHNKFSNNFNSPFTQTKPKEIPKSSLPTSQPQGNQPFGFNTTPFQQRFPNRSFVPQRNNWIPDQRQQWGQNKLSGNVRPSGSGNYKNSGNFRQQPNMPNQQVNPPQKVSDVTMRSVNRPQKAQSEELFYTSGDQDQYQESYDACYEQGECYNLQYANTSNMYQEMPEDANISYPQDFSQGTEQEDHS